MKERYNAWIDRDGKFYPVQELHHTEYAWDYVGKEPEKSKYEKYCEEIQECDPMQYLHRLGWIKLQSWQYGKYNLYGNCTSNIWEEDTIDPKMSQAQKDSVKRWCRKEGIDYATLFIDSYTIPETVKKITKDLP